MKTKLADKILHQLIDSYERRADPQARRISVKLAKADFPEYYNEEDASVKRDTNTSLKEWASQNWVALEWVRHEKDNLLKEVTLQIEAIDAIYAYLKRSPKTILQSQLTDLITRYRARLRAESPFRPVLDERLAQLANGKSSQPFDINKRLDNEDLLKALVGLDWLESDELERKFSARVLGDSKRLIELKSSLKRLVIKAYPEWEGLEDKAFWSAMQIVANPSHIYVHGRLRFCLQGVEVDTAIFSPDLGLPIEAISQMDIVALEARYLLTIENRTSFYDYVKAFPHDGLILYLGGFPNHARRQFLKRLVEFAPTKPFYHWGDLDYGGLQILAHLRREVQPQIIPLQMDLETLERHAGETLDSPSRANLARLLKNDLLRDMVGVIEKMLANNIKRIEQENLAPVSPSAS